MSLNKYTISKKISKNLFIPTSNSSKILDHFFQIIKKKSKSSDVKVPSFGTFSYKKTPKRTGRNPKNKDSYTIPALNKLNFRPSNKIKKILN